MGFDKGEEVGELRPLSSYLNEAVTREKNPKENLMCVIDEACSSCVQINYDLSTRCRGCVARSCYMNCPKNAIDFKKNGQAEINHDKCISCGICQNNCPYHAIIYVPIPCEEVCPVKAIKRDADGTEYIDESKCIYCGKCINACPFGAIFEISQVFDVLRDIRAGKQVVAMVAPAVLSQFNASIDQIYGALKAMGFTDVIEVAQGAMETTRLEAEEFVEKMEEGQPFMTTSCCPSYIQLAKKHLPEIEKYISTTGSPMYYTAKVAREKYPEAKTVFIGPCIAKRKEAHDNEDVDYVLTFEEMSSLFSGYELDIEQVPAYKMAFTASKEAHGFAQTGGVTNAVKAELKHAPINAMQVSNLNKKNIALLRAYAKSGKCPSQFIEVMACEGGCITGPCSQTDKASASKQFNKAMAGMNNAE